MSKIGITCFLVGLFLVIASAAETSSRQDANGEASAQKRADAIRRQNEGQNDGISVIHVDDEESNTSAASRRQFPEQDDAAVRANTKRTHNDQRSDDYADEISVATIKRGNMPNLNDFFESKSVEMNDAFARQADAVKRTEQSDALKRTAQSDALQNDDLNARNDNASSRQNNARNDNSQNDDVSSQDDDINSQDDEVNSQDDEVNSQDDDLHSRHDTRRQEPCGIRRAEDESSINSRQMADEDAADDEIIADAAQRADASQAAQRADAADAVLASRQAMESISRQVESRQSESNMAMDETTRQIADEIARKRQLQDLQAADYQRRQLAQQQEIARFIQMQRQQKLQSRQLAQDELRQRTLQDQQRSLRQIADAQQASDATWRKFESHFSQPMNDGALRNAMSRLQAESDSKFRRQQDFLNPQSRTREAFVSPFKSRVRRKVSEEVINEIELAMAAQRELLEQQYRELQGEGKVEPVRKSTSKRRKATETANTEDPNTECTVEMVLAGECTSEPEPCDKDYKYNRNDYDCSQYTATVDKDSKLTETIRALESFKSPKF